MASPDSNLDQDLPLEVSRCPAPTLPAEILLEILGYLVQNTPLGTSVVDTDVLFAFSRVSDSWRRVSIAESNLWRDVDLAWPVDRYEAWLSRAATLSLRCHYNENYVFEDPEAPWTRNLQALSACGEVVELLSLSTPSTSVAALIIDAMGPHLLAPLTLEIDLTRRSSTGVDRVLIHSRALAKIRHLAMRGINDLENGRITTLPLLEIRTLRLLEIPATTYLPNMYSQMPSLTQLTLSLRAHATYLNLVARRRVHQSHFYFATMPPPMDVQIPSLETLVVGTAGWTASVIAYEVRLPRLRTLVLASRFVDVQTVYKLSSACSTIRSLRVDSRYAIEIFDMLYISPELDMTWNESRGPHLFPALQELQIGSLPRSLDESPYIPDDIQTNPIWLKYPQNATTGDGLRQLLRDDGGLHLFFSAREARDIPHLRRLHIHVPHDTLTRAEIEGILAAKEWLRDAADEVTLDASPPWKVVQSEDGV